MLEKQTRYKVNATTLYQLFESFFKEHFNFQPIFQVSIEDGFLLPIVVEIKQENSEVFEQFWLDLHEQIESIPNKRHYSTGTAELGDKLLQLCLGHPTLDYEEVYGEKGIETFALVDEQQDLLQEKEKGRAFIEALKEERKGFPFTETDFSNLAIEPFTLQKIDVNVFEGEATLLLKHRENVTLEIFFSKYVVISDIEVIRFKQVAYCHNEQLISDTKTLCKQVLSIIQDKLGVNQEQINIKDNLYLLPFEIIYYPFLNQLQNVVYSLHKKGLNALDISVLIDKTKDDIESTIRTLRSKGLLNET